MEIRNLNNKLICILSEDKKFLEVCIRGCLTRFWANPDGTLSFSNKKVANK